MEMNCNRNREAASWPPLGELNSDVEFLSDVLHASTEYSVIGKDADGKIVSWNEGARRLHGYEADEMLGRHYFSTLHAPEELHAGRDSLIISQVRQSGSWEGPVQTVRKDGSRLSGWLKMSPRLNRRGDTVGFLVLIKPQAANNAEMGDDAWSRVQASEQGFRLLVESVQDYAIVMLDAQGRLTSWNSGAHKILGYRDQEILGQNCRCFYPPEDIAAKKPELELAMARCYGRWEDEGWRVRRDGSQFWANEVITALREPNGELRGFGKVTRDMTERMRAQNKMLQINKELEARVKARLEELIHTEEKLANILGSIDDVVWSASKDQFFYINPVAEKIYGRPLDEFYRDRDIWFDVIHPEDRERVREAVAGLRGSDTLTHEYRIIRPDGSMRWLECKARAISDKKGKLVRIDGVTTDISERKRYQGHIEFLAGHDVLTGLANRHLLGDRLQMAILHARRNKRRLGLLFLDLNRFKYVNDSFGHGVGDLLLKQVAQRLTQQVRESDTVFRQGGDEFIILLTDLNHADEAANVATKIIEAFAPPFMVDGHELHMTASIGATIFPDDSSDIDILLQNADTAMYRAKADNSSGFLFYSREMRTRARERVKLENALRRAIKRNEFELCYQPKVHLVTGRIIGAEALIRWNAPDFGHVMPNSFIPLAEEVGLIGPIGNWVLQTACRQNKAWQEAGFAPIEMAVNLSVSQLRQDEVVDTVEKALRESGLDGCHLELEVTESLVMNSAEQYISKLHALKALGVQLSVDDFGTGYSSLSYLKRFALDRLKIDRSFIHDIAADSEDAAITRSVIALGHSLNLKVIAEGVETPEQLRFLREHHCDEIQGFYFSRPLTADQFAALLTEKRLLS